MLGSQYIPNLLGYYFIWFIAVTFYLSSFPYLFWVNVRVKKILVKTLYIHLPWFRLLSFNWLWNLKQRALEDKLLFFETRIDKSIKCIRLKDHVFTTSHPSTKRAHSNMQISFLAKLTFKTELDIQTFCS